MSRMSCEDTKVPVERSRGEIAKILARWGALGVQWEDDLQTGTATLRFRWRPPEGGADLVARLRLAVDNGNLRRLRTPTPHLDKVREKWREQERRRLHRVAVHWLRAQHAAIESGLFKAETVILPWLEDATGATIGEALAGRLGALGSADMGRRLALPGGS